jgi:hypothetical protein
LVGWWHVGALGNLGRQEFSRVRETIAVIIDASAQAPMCQVKIT